MRKRWKPIVALVALSLVLLSGCGSRTSIEREVQSADGGEPQQTAQLSRESRETIDPEQVQTLMDMLGCSERTAQSMYNTLASVTSGMILEMQVDDQDFYRVIRYEDDSGDVFYAIVDRGYLISSIQADSLDGRVVYKQIQ